MSKKLLTICGTVWLLAFVVMIAADKPPTCTNQKVTRVEPVGHIRHTSYYIETDGGSYESKKPEMLGSTVCL